jgi:hypothetical protein
MPGLVQVVTPATASNLTTLDDARMECGQDDTSQDVYLARLVKRASSTIANYCGVVFGVQTINETFRFGWEPGVGPASQTVAPYGTPLNIQRKPLVLSEAPNVAITGILENGNALTAGTDFEFDADAGLVYRLSSNGMRSFWNVPTVVVSYTAGWILPGQTGRNLPDDLEQVCLSLIRAAFMARGRDPSVAMDTLNGDRTQYWDRSVSAMSLDDDMKVTLSDYVSRVW